MGLYAKEVRPKEMRGIAVFRKRAIGRYSDDFKKAVVIDYMRAYNRYARMKRSQGHCAGWYDLTYVRALIVVKDQARILDQGIY